VSIRGRSWRTRRTCWSTEVVRWTTEVVRATAGRAMGLERPVRGDGAPVNARRRSVEPGGSGECPEALVSVLETPCELPKRLGGGILTRSGEPEFSKHS
jgi:hypothetical protein